MKECCFLGVHTRNLLYSPDGVHGDIRVDVAGDLAGVHVGDVLEVTRQAVVLHDEGVEDIGEVDVAVLIAGVDTAVLLSAAEMAFNSFVCTEPRSSTAAAFQSCTVLGDSNAGLDTGRREIFLANLSISGVKSCRPLCKSNEDANSELSLVIVPGCRTRRRKRWPWRG